MDPFKKLIQMNDESVMEAMKQQIDEPGSRYDGGIRNDVLGIPSPNNGGTPAYMAALTAALLTPESRFYHDGQVLMALDKTAAYMLNNQHEDGTISLGSTNFNSPPDTGFVVTGLVQMYTLLTNDSWENVAPTAAKIKLFLERTIPALLTGGCHTPNHRWVMTAALGALYQVFKQEQLVIRADEWLAEGIDCTEDGEWTERSNGIYNVVSNMMLYYTAAYLDRPELLAYVGKNLKMMIYMIHPNGEVVTDYSGRQDLGESTDLSGYFLPYLIMADHNRDIQFATMSDLALQKMTSLGSASNHALLAALMFPTDIADLKRTPLPIKYTKIINEHHPVDRDLIKMEQAGHHSKILHSGVHTAFGAPVVRYRNNETSMTAMTRNPSFFSLHHGNVKLLGTRIYTKFTPGFVEMKQFSRGKTEYFMKTVMEKGYNGPISSEHLPETSLDTRPWHLLPHQLRTLTHVQQHQIETVVGQEESGFKIHVKSDQRPDVITQISFMFASDCTLSGIGLEPKDDQTIAWKQDKLRSSSKDDWIEISWGQRDHELQYLNTNYHQHGIQTVVVNLLTPFDKTFRIRLSE